LNVVDAFVQITMNMQTVSSPCSFLQTHTHTSLHWLWQYWKITSRANYITLYTAVIKTIQRSWER